MENEFVNSGVDEVLNTDVNEGVNTEVVNTNNENDDTGTNRWYEIWWVVIFVIISLLIGIWGYYYLGHLSLIDSLLNASMILGGMGPVDMLETNKAKIFASLYALYSGIVFLVLVALVIDNVVN